MKSDFIVDNDNCDKRLDKYLAEKLSDYSREQIISAIKAGDIAVNGLSKKPSYRVSLGEEITLIISKPKDVLIPHEFKLKIVHEDSDIIVVNKPSSLATHPPNFKYSQAVVNALIYMKKELFKSSSPLRPGVVHRLDKETTGLLVLAKNEQSFNNLVGQFKARKIKKIYRAITHGIINEDKLKIDLPLARDSKNRLKMKVSFVEAKEALTEVEVLRRFRQASYLNITLSTGRMHQIRIHLKFLGFPILGDKKYGIKDGLNDLFLHAHILGFEHPVNSKYMEFKADLPSYFNNYIEDKS